MDHPDQQNRLERNREFVEANRRLWELWTPHHIGSALYNVEGFRAGADPLDRLVLETLGEVRGQSLLHLQCHFGLDTLALARRGAVVTGVDFSTAAVCQARRLARELELPARFIECDIYELSRHLTEEFDVVFTSIGAICWLPDLAPWARIIASALKPGGRFCLVDAHPFMQVFDERRTDGILALREPYFSSGAPLTEEAVGSYAAPDAPVRASESVWLHSVEDILGALLGAGLRLRSFREYPLLAWPFFPDMELAEPGLWRRKGRERWLPLTLCVTATKE
jgi:SAM-dependent methyltransferase